MATNLRLTEEAEAVPQKAELARTSLAGEDRVSKNKEIKASSSSWRGQLVPSQGRSGAGAPGSQGTTVRCSTDRVGDAPPDGGGPACSRRGARRAAKCPPSSRDGRHSSPAMGRTCSVRSSGPADHGVRTHTSSCEDSAAFCARTRTRGLRRRLAWSGLRGCLLRRCLLRGLLGHSLLRGLLGGALAGDRSASALLRQ
jgi:hypothetical protein